MTVRNKNHFARHQAACTRISFLTSHRRGYTLIETLAALSLLSLLATSSVGILAAATNMSTRQAHARQSRRDVQRLAETFRKDASNTLQTVVPESDWPVTLKQNDSSVVYNWDEHKLSLTREVKGKESGVRFERYLMPQQSTPRVFVRDRRLALEIALQGNQTPWVVEAILKSSGK
jgi:prepilin-type N-terminal cleavage/methylation domain-containing protein